MNVGPPVLARGIMIWTGFQNIAVFYYSKSWRSFVDVYIWLALKYFIRPPTHREILAKSALIK